jgi:hypothetical protein
LTYLADTVVILRYFERPDPKGNFRDQEAEWEPRTNRKIKMSAGKNFEPGLPRREMPGVFTGVPIFGREAKGEQLIDPHK